MNNAAPYRCPVLIVEQQPCLVALMQSRLEQAGFGPIYHARVYTALLARWAAFFGAIILLDLSLQNRQLVAPTDSVLQYVQESSPIDLSPADSPLLVLLEHAGQLAALPSVRHDRDFYLIKPFDPDELLRLIDMARRQQRASTTYAPSIRTDNSTVRAQKRSVRYFTLAGLGKRGRSVC